MVWATLRARLDLKQPPGVGLHWRATGDAIDELA
jgi:hypothetical protein